VFLSNGREALHSCFCNAFWPSNLFPDKKFLNDQKGINLMALVQDYVVDAAEVATSAFATRLLSGLKCEVMFHHAEDSFQRLIFLVSFVNGFAQFFESFPVFVTVDCCFWWQKFTQ
jgi:hypothetical protein